MFGEVEVCLPGRAGDAEHHTVAAAVYCTSKCSHSEECKLPRIKGTAHSFVRFLRSAHLQSKVSNVEEMHTKRLSHEAEKVIFKHDSRDS